jgi:hypothetical protein
MVYISLGSSLSSRRRTMEHPLDDEEPEFDDTLPEDIRIHRISVPGGWVFITYARRKDGEETYTSQLSTVYVPGRR